MKQSPNRTVVTSFSTPSSSVTDYDEGHYVLHVTTSGPQSPSSSPPPHFVNFVSCALTNHSILTYDATTLQQTHSISAHDERITDLSYIQNTANVCLGSCGYDGQIKIWDVRTPPSAAPVINMTLPRKDVPLSTSFGYNGALAAVGGAKGLVYFYDLRNVSSGGGRMGVDVGGGDKPLGQYSNAHTDEVTQVQFQPSENGASPLLLTGSEDGLACVFDTSQASEEKALKSILNISSPLRHVGFFGPNLEGVYCLTGSESLSVWHHDSAQRIRDFGPHVRDTLSGLGGGGGMLIQYLVNCHWDGRNLNLVAGNSDGVSAVFCVDATGLAFQRQLNGGHKGCIRDYAVLGNGTILTGGEDARMCEWTLGDASGIGDSARNEINIRAGAKKGEYRNSGGGKMKRSKGKKGHAPY